MKVGRRLKHWRVAFSTAALVALLAAAKWVIHEQSWDVIELNPLYSSVVAGGIFVIGLIVAGVLSDYKEAEKMPADLTGALENIYHDCLSLARSQPTFDLAALRERLLAIVVALQRDVVDPEGRESLGAIADLSESIFELEELDVPANYIVRLRAEQGLIRRNVLRIYHIARTQFLPSAYVLIQTVIALIISALLFTNVEPLQEALVVLVLISYFFLYLLRLLRIMDTPFREDGTTMDDVSMFLVKEFSERLTADAQSS